MHFHGPIVFGGFLDEVADTPVACAADPHFNENLRYIKRRNSIFFKKSQHQFVISRYLEIRVEATVLFVYFLFYEKGRMRWHPTPLEETVSVRRGFPVPDYFVGSVLIDIEQISVTTLHIVFCHL